MRQQYTSCSSLSSRISPIVLCLSLFACASSDPNERTTGKGGSLIRYSSTQKYINLNEKERAGYEQLRLRAYAGDDIPAMLDKASSALKAMQFAAVSTDLAAGMVEAEKNQVLADQWRQLTRGLLKAKIPLPARPDHSHIKAIVNIRPQAKENRLQVALKLEETIWDSNGDSKTKIILEPKMYQDFFSRLE